MKSPLEIYINLALEAARLALKRGGDPATNERAAAIVIAEIASRFSPAVRKDLKDSLFSEVVN